MMRIVLIVLTLYTVALSCMPCQDEVEVASYGSAVVLIKPDSKHQKSAELDLCSPFCTCSCCARISLQHQIALLPLKAGFSTFDEITFLYLPSTHSGDLTSIWQPPRA